MRLAGDAVEDVGKTEDEDRLDEDWYGEQRDDDRLVEDLPALKGGAASCALAEALRTEPMRTRGAA
jgi:hypothetical protein